VPARPAEGEILEMLGGTKKLLLVVKVPLGPWIEMGPVVTFVGADTVISESVALNPGALVPLKLTLVVVARCAPLMCTVVPTVPITGSNPLTKGPEPMTVKGLELLPVPLAEVMPMGQLLAPPGTFTLM